MVFQSDTYSVLLVSSSEKMNTAILSLLPPTDFWPVTTVHSLSQARRHLLEREEDIILVNAPLTDGSGVQFCMDESANSQSAVALLVRSEFYEETYYRCLPHGVFTFSKPLDRETLTGAMRSLCTVRERIRAMQKKQATVEERMEELRLINKAKWLLIRNRGCSEEEAHRSILSRAMEQRRSKKEIAQEIIRSFSESAP